MDLMKVAGRLTGRIRVPTVHVAWVARAFGRRDLAPLRPDDVAALATTLERLEVESGTTIVAAGAAAEAAYIVQEGEVALYARPDDERTLVSVQRTGGVFGDVPLLCALPLPYDAVARRDTRLLVVPEDDLVGLLSEHPAIALRWLTSAVRRLEHANRRLASLTTGDVAGRVAALLADELASSPDDVVARHVELTQREIAALLGASRQAVNRALKGLVDDQVIRTEYGRVVVEDPHELLERGGRTFPVAPTC